MSVYTPFVIREANPPKSYFKKIKWILWNLKASLSRPSRRDGESPREAMWASYSTGPHPLANSSSCGVLHASSSCFPSLCAWLPTPTQELGAVGCHTVGSQDSGFWQSVSRTRIQKTHFPLSSSCPYSTPPTPGLLFGSSTLPTPSHL